MAQARERVSAARVLLDGGLMGPAVSSAYYAMLYAARAALSEEDRYAKTHRGTWDLFQELYVSGGRFDQELLTAARRIQKQREDVDYDAATLAADEAERIVETAGEFVRAVDGALSG